MMSLAARSACSPGIWKCRWRSGAHELADEGFEQKVNAFSETVCSNEYEGACTHTFAAPSWLRFEMPLLRLCLAELGTRRLKYLDSTLRFTPVRRKHSRQSIGHAISSDLPADRRHSYISEQQHRWDIELPAQINGCPTWITQSKPKVLVTDGISRSGAVNSSSTSNGRSVRVKATSKSGRRASPSAMVRAFFPYPVGAR